MQYGRSHVPGGPRGAAKAIVPVRPRVFLYPSCFSCVAYVTWGPARMSTSRRQWRTAHVETGFYPPVTYMLMDDLVIDRMDRVRCCPGKVKKAPGPILQSGLSAGGQIRVVPQRPLVRSGAGSRIPCPCAMKQRPAGGGAKSRPGGEVPSSAGASCRPLSREPRIRLRL